MCWGAFSSVPCAFAQCVVFLLFLCPALRKKCPVRWAAGDAKVLVWELHVPNPSPMTHACVGVSGWSLFLFSTPFFHAFPSTRHAHQVQVFSPEYCIFISLPLSAFFFARPATTPRGKRSFSIGPGLGVAGKVGLMQSAGKPRLLTYAHRWQVWERCAIDNTFAYTYAETIRNFSSALPFLSCIITFKSIVKKVLFMSPSDRKTTHFFSVLCE